MMLKKNKKILWLSANKLGYELLKEALKIKNIDIVGLITLSSTSITKMYDGISLEKWKKLKIHVYEIEKINNSIKLVKKLVPDLIVMCGWRQIIPKEILNLPKMGIIGFHPTLLPKGRGSAPIINSILSSFSKSGITMFRVDSGVDTGPIIAQQTFNINKNDHAMNVYKKIINKGRILIKRELPLFLSGKSQEQKQDESKATVFQKRNIFDNEIKKTDLLTVAYLKIKAFSKPYLGAFLKKDGKKLVIWKADLYEN